jgi:hemerythrin-like domain-containing protein
VNGELGDRMMAVHAELDERYFAHQVALLDRDFPRALQRLRHYRELLLIHMADEEQHVLPHYRDLGGDATNAPVKLFLGEHARMREFVADAERRCEALCERADDRALLELLDREATYKNLVLHHDLRERNALYPFLGAQLDAAAQRALLARMAGLAES